MHFTRAYCGKNGSGTQKVFLCGEHLFVAIVAE